MNSVKDLDAMMMASQSLDGENQQGEVTITKLAKKMFPYREEWEQLGFVFADIPGDEMFVNAQLPIGWKMEGEPDSIVEKIIDENGLDRAAIISNYKDDTSMQLLSRYGIRTNYIDSKNGSTHEIYFGNEKEKIFIAGRVFFADEYDDETRKELYKIEDRLEKVARKYADEHYPNWANVLAYWNDEAQKASTTSQK